ncbi:uncharacterized protein EI90DRAFT_3151995 [Cantharellus anzutake]|uniref:uncharacterized protein n=1 Tax=Cantharellus anzutake TaxID=1750568 RepID=UPI00190898C7|nr:uncharacterized protein EI90DRAFT_3151995 [Cantharellus anzutake]KAF8338254.1 hypothetical protein EI90DRAFT_3151995 [Cantharellus anzutake]
MLLRVKQHDKTLNIAPIVVTGRGTFLTSSPRPHRPLPSLTNTRRRPSRFTSSSTTVWDSWKWLTFLPGATMHTPSLDSLVRALHDALSKRDVRYIEQTYNALVEHLSSERYKGSPPTQRSSGITPELLYQMTRVIIKNPFTKASFKVHLYNSGRRFALAQRIYKDVKDVFGLTPMERHTELVFRAHSVEDPHGALEWLSGKGGITPNISHFEISMRGLAHKRDVEGMKELISTVKNIPGIHLTSDLYAPLVLSSFPPIHESGDIFTPKNPPPHISLSTRTPLEEMEREGVTPSVKLIAELIFQYHAFGSHEDVQSLAEDLKGILTDQAQTLLHNDEKDAVAALIAAAATTAQPEGDESPYSCAIREAENFHSRGFQLGSRALVVLLGLQGAPMFDAEGIITLATGLGIAHELRNVVIWSVAIRQAVKRDRVGLGDGFGLDRALGMYKEALNRGIIPNSALLDPLIHALCTRKSPPDPDDVDKALQLYYDLRDSEGMGPFARTRTGRRFGPDQGIFITLLSSISRIQLDEHSSGPSTSDIIIQLLIDMRDSRLAEPLPPSFVRDIFTRLLLHAPSHDASFKLYSYLREIDPTLLDRTGYEQILLQFTKLSFEDDPLPDQAHYMDIVKDMRDAGIPMTSFVYNVLLTRYAALAKSSAEGAFNSISSAGNLAPEQERAKKLRGRLLQATQKLHRTLKLDASVNPDIITFNALMNAYNHLGAFGDAFEIWGQLTLGFPVPYDNSSISIILDICGYTRSANAVDAVWNLVTSKTMNSHRVRPNANNWASRMECYARMGDFDRVIGIFKEMCTGSKQGPDVPAPNQAITQLLIKFGRVFKREEEVVTLLKAEVPDLYSSMTPIPTQAARG